MKTREIIIESLNFDKSERATLKELINELDDIENKKVYFNFAFTTIDKKHFIDVIKQQVDFFVGLWETQLNNNTGNDTH